MASQSSSCLSSTSHATFCSASFLNSGAISRSSLPTLARNSMLLTRERIWSSVALASSTSSNCSASEQASPNSTSQAAVEDPHHFHNSLFDLAPKALIAGSPFTASDHDTHSPTLTPAPPAPSLAAVAASPAYPPIPSPNSFTSLATSKFT